MKGLAGLLLGAAMMAIAIIMLCLGLSHVFSTVGGAIYFGIIIVLFPAGLLVWYGGWGALADHSATRDPYKPD